MYNKEDMRWEGQDNPTLHKIRQKRNTKRIKPDFPRRKHTN